MEKLQAEQGNDAQRESFSRRPWADPRRNECEKSKTGSERSDSNDHARRPNAWN
jgi:hypothetical protein